MVIFKNCLTIFIFYTFFISFTFTFKKGVYCTGSVSYTHLDVYKRQELYRDQKEKDPHYPHRNLTVRQYRTVSCVSENGSVRLQTRGKGGIVLSRLMTNVWGPSSSKRRLLIIVRRLLTHVPKRHFYLRNKIIKENYS